MKKSAYLLIFSILFLACNKEEDITLENDDNTLNYSGGQVELIVQSGNNYSMNWTYNYETEENLSSIETYHQSSTRKFYINTESGLIDQYYVSSPYGISTHDYNYSNNILTSTIMSNKTGGRDLWSNTNFATSVNANNELIIEGVYRSGDNNNNNNNNTTSPPETLEKIRFNNSTKSHISGGGLTNLTYNSSQNVFEKIKLIGNVHKQFPIISFSDFNLVRYDGEASDG